MDNRSLCPCCDSAVLLFGVCKCVGLQVRPPQTYIISMLDVIKFIASTPSKAPALPLQSCC